MFLYNLKYYSPLHIQSKRFGPSFKVNKKFHFIDTCTNLDQLPMLFK